MRELKVSPLKISKSPAPLRCPPDKSVTHRSFLFSLLSAKTSRVRDPLFGEDCLASLEAVRQLGAQVERKGDQVTITGFGVRDFGAKPDKAHVLQIDCQNSGTTMRLLHGLLSGQKGYFRLFGDESLSKRPMARVSKPLVQMGAMIFPRGEHKGAPCPPVDIEPCPGGLKAMAHISPVASAQVKSAILLAGLWCDGETSVTEPSLSRDHTERMLRGMGVDVKTRLNADGTATAVLPARAARYLAGEALSPLDLSVGGDPSSAAFWACAAVMQGRKVSVGNVLLNPTRLGFAEVLKRMGAKITLTISGIEGGEDVGLVTVDGSVALRATTVEPAEVPTLVDEVPMLAIASLWAKGTTVFRGVQELRVKESDRLEAIIDFITSIGGKAWAVQNDLHVEGLGGAPAGPSAKHWHYETLGDHRLAMAAVITADALQREIVLDDADCIKVSYPSFFEHRESLTE